MDVRLLEQLVKLMADNGLTTVELTDGERRIMLKRGAETVTMAQPPVYSYAPPAPAGTTPAPPPSSSPGANGGAGEDDSALVPIKSIMPGTFYSAPAKGAKAFVTLGSRVEEDTDVCIVEAMKVFNTIKAETRGIIARILVQDSQPVEFGQVLFLVKPN
jgi:acetyl-CoA carboxylase biotin carboxyl carrier protein